MGEFAGGGGIMRAIEVNVGAGVQLFEAAGPDGVGNALGDGVAGDSEAAFPEKAHGGDGVQSVLELETAGKAWGDFENRSGGRLSDARADASVLHGFPIDAKDLRRLDDRAAERMGASKNHFAGFGPLLGKDDRNSGFQDSGFFGCDLVQRVAQKIFVVEIDAGDDGGERRKDVGGIEAAAQADFEDGKVYALAGKIFESHGGYAFEISRVGAKFACGEELFDQRMDASEGFGEGFVADLFATDADAFVDFFEVRRGIQSRSKASMAKDGFEERGCGAFAVGAGDVGAGISAFRAAEALREEGDVFEIELCGGGLGRSGQFAAEGEQVADQGLVFHLSSRASRESW